jgi:vacuolar-type H+-ATPase subunit I/STV1
MEKKFLKTEEELKQMNDSDLFEYLDAKAAYLKQYTSPLSSYKTKKFASIGAAISNTEFDYDSVKQIAKENEQKGYEKFIKDKNKNNE